MKKKKLLALTLALSLILLVSYAAVPVRNECSKDEHCPGGMRCLLHPNGFLVCRVPGPGEGVGSNWREYDTYCKICKKSRVPSCMWDAEGFGGNCTPSRCTSCGSTMGGFFH